DAPVEALDDVLVVEAVDGRHHQQVGPRLLQHLVEAGEGRAVDADELLRHLRALRVRIAEADELEQIRVALHQIAAPHNAAAPATLTNSRRELVAASDIFVPPAADPNTRRARRVR